MGRAEDRGITVTQVSWRKSRCLTMNNLETKKPKEINFSNNLKNENEN